MAQSMDPAVQSSLSSQLAAVVAKDPTAVNQSLSFTGPDGQTYEYQPPQHDVTVQGMSGDQTQSQGSGSGGWIQQMAGGGGGGLTSTSAPGVAYDLSGNYIGTVDSSTSLTPLGMIALAGSVAGAGGAFAGAGSGAAASGGAAAGTGAGTASTGILQTIADSTGLSTAQVTQAALGAAQGAMSNPSDPLKGALIGAGSSLVGAGAGAAATSAGASQIVSTLASGAATGGTSAALNGGNIEKGIVGGGLGAVIASGAKTLINGSGSLPTASSSTTSGNNGDGYYGSTGTTVGYGNVTVPSDNVTPPANSVIMGYNPDGSKITIPVTDSTSGNTSATVDPNLNPIVSVNSPLNDPLNDPTGPGITDPFTGIKTTDPSTTSGTVGTDSNGLTYTAPSSNNPTDPGYNGPLLGSPTDVNGLPTTPTSPTTGSSGSTGSTGSTGTGTGTGTSTSSASGGNNNAELSSLLAAGTTGTYSPLKFLTPGDFKVGASSTKELPEITPLNELYSNLNGAKGYAKGGQVKAVPGTSPLAGLYDQLATVSAQTGWSIPALLLKLQRSTPAKPPVFKTGGDNHVKGAGGGQDDLIDAKLADGEYVFDADIVSALGDGSNKEGAKKLDEMREAIRAHKRSAPNDKIPPKAKSPLSYLNKR